MPRNGSGVYSLPANTEAVTGEKISSAKFNSLTGDLEADANTTRPVSAGGTGADNSSDARDNLGAAAQSDMDAASEWILNAGKIYGATGAANAFEATAPITAYEAGQVFTIRFTDAPTGAATIDINGLGPVSIKRINSSNNTVDIANANWKAGDLVKLIHDGTNFIMGSTISHSPARWRDRTQENTAVISPADLHSAARAASVPVAILEDQKASGTDGGGATSGAWFGLDLNTEAFNDEGLITLSSNEFIPDVDGYIEWESQGFSVGDFATRLYNITDTDAVTVGSSAYSAADASANSTGGANVLAGKNYRLEMQCSTTHASNGLGRACGFGSTEVFRRLTFWAGG